MFAIQYVREPRVQCTEISYFYVILTVKDGLPEEKATNFIHVYICQEEVFVFALIIVMFTWSFYVTSGTLADFTRKTPHEYASASV